MGTASSTAGGQRGSSRAGRIAATGAATAVIAAGGLFGAGIASADTAPAAPAAGIPCQTSQGLVAALSTTACRLLGGVVVTTSNVTGTVTQAVPQVVQVVPRVIQQPARVITQVPRAVTQAPSKAASPSTGSSSAKPSTSGSSTPAPAASAPAAAPRAVAVAPAATPVAPTQNYNALLSSAFDRLPTSFAGTSAPGGFASLAPGFGTYDPGLLFSSNAPFRALPASPVSSNSTTQALSLPDTDSVGVPLLAAVLGGAVILALAVRSGVLRRVRRNRT